MPFEQGNLSFLVGHLPEPLPEDALERFQGKAGTSLASVMEDPELGWVSGRHLLETRIDDQTAYAGGYLHLHLRVAQRRVPASLFKAECRMEELAYQQANNGLMVSRQQRKEIRAAITERLLKQAPPTIAGIPFVVDAPHQVIYVGAGSPQQFDKFALFFHETMGFEPVLLGPDEVTAVVFGVEPHNVRALHFSPDTPFRDDREIGRDFCTWMWYFCSQQGGTFRVADRGDFAVAIDGPLLFAAEIGGAMESAVRKGTPTQSAEAKAALLVGKKLRQARFTLARDREVWSFTLDADRFAFRSTSLPPIESLDPHSTFQQRVLHLTILREAFLALFELYLEQVTDQTRWERLQPAIYEWVTALEAL